MRSTERMRREQTIISCIGFGHSWLNNILYFGKHWFGKCDYCVVNETIEHVMLFCQNYEEERQQLIQNLNQIKYKLDLVNLFRNNSKYNLSDNILLTKQNLIL